VHVYVYDFTHLTHFQQKGPQTMIQEKLIESVFFVDILNVIWSTLGTYVIHILIKNVSSWYSYDTYCLTKHVDKVQNDLVCLFYDEYEYFVIEHFIICYIESCISHLPTTSK
jgi:hypothetical protein